VSTHDSFHRFYVIKLEITVVFIANILIVSQSGQLAYVVNLLIKYITINYKIYMLLK